MIKITLNGKIFTMEEPISIFDLIVKQGLNPNNIAVEVNGLLCPRSAHKATIVQDGFIIELVSFVGGG